MRLCFNVVLFPILHVIYRKLPQKKTCRFLGGQKLLTSICATKTIALYGMGDQIGYSEWFQDALGMLDEAIQQIDPDNTIRRIGYWPNEGYDFMESKALTADRSHFVGLALDEDQQYELSDERIAAWCTQILEEIAEG